MSNINNSQDHAVCNDILKQLQRSLCKCVSNSKIYEYNTLERMLNIKDCKNIETYKKSLGETKTKVNIIPSFIKPDTRYIINYDVHERSIVMDELEPLLPIL
jgi:hypothetical protein